MKSLLTQQNGKTLVYSTFAEEWTPLVPNIAARSDVAPTCVKVNFFDSIIFTAHKTNAGDELSAFLERHLPDYDRVVYIGDGSNDFCPILRLRR